MISGVAVLVVLAGWVPEATAQACYEAYPGAGCNTDHPEYACPATKPELQIVVTMPGDQARATYGGEYCNSSAFDSGNFEHVGECFREITGGYGGGQQCCYDANGLDNGSGSYDEWGCATGEQLGGTCSFDVTCLGAHCLADVHPVCCALSGGDPSVFESCIGGGWVSCASYRMIIDGLEWEDCGIDPEPEPEPPPSSGGSGGGGGGFRIEPNYDGGGTCGSCTSRDGDSMCEANCGGAGYGSGSCTGIDDSGDSCTLWCECG